jgi:hypothetical protein
VVCASGIQTRLSDDCRRWPECGAEEACASDVAWKARLAALSGADAARFREAVGTAAEPFVNGGRLRLVATSLFLQGESDYCHRPR